MKKEILWVDEKTVAKILCCSEQTLRNARFKKKMLTYYKNGSSVRYRIDHVYDFMEKKRIEIDE